MSGPVGHASNTAALGCQAHPLLRAPRTDDRSKGRERPSHRVDMMMQIEKTLKLLTPEGYKNIAVLVDIAKAVRKYEVGEEWLKGASGVRPSGRPYPGGLSPHEVQQPEQSEMGKRFASLDAVDRNLIRAATTHLIEMITEECGRLSSEAGRLASESGTKVGDEN